MQKDIAEKLLAEERELKLKPGKIEFTVHAAAAKRGYRNVISKKLGDKHIGVYGMGFVAGRERVFMAWPNGGSPVCWYPERTVSGELVLIESEPPAVALYTERKV